MLAMYGFGCETMSGIFPIENSPEAVTLSSKLHGAGSAIGCTVFLFVPLLLGVAQFPNRRAYGIVCIVCFILAVVFIVFFVMGEKKRFRNTVFALTGLWQRLLLYVCYLPLTLFGILLFA